MARVAAGEVVGFIAQAGVFILHLGWVGCNLAYVLKARDFATFAGVHRPLFPPCHLCLPLAPLWRRGSLWVAPLHS